MIAIVAAVGLAAVSTSCSTATNGEDIFDALASCELVGATFVQTGEALTLHLPGDFYPSLNQAPTSGRVACFKRWADERGYQLTVEQVSS